MRAINIKWVVDEDMSKDEINLPNEIEIPKDSEYDEDAISDYISDETGFLHEGFELDSGKSL